MFLSKIGTVYYLYFSDDTGARQKVSTSCRKKSDALVFLQDFKLNEYEKRKKLKTISLSDFRDQFIEYSAGIHTPKTLRTHVTAFREFLRVEGNKHLHSIGIREIEHFLSVKKREASEWTARKYYGSLAAAFEKGLQWEYLLENPFRKVAKPKECELQPAYFTETDFRVLLSVIDERDFRELCITALLTGLRLDELLHLCWRDIDFTSKLIQIRNSNKFSTKTRKNRIVPISDELYRLLTNRKETIRFESEFIFYNKKGGKLRANSVSMKFKKYVRRAHLDDKLHFHSLRHSFASALVRSGVSLYAVQKLLGHSTIKTTEVYSHLLPQQLHSEINKGLHTIEGGLFNSLDRERG